MIGKERRTRRTLAPHHPGWHRPPGTAAAYNAFARKGVDQLENLIGGGGRRIRLADRIIAFTKRGEGPPLLLIHCIHPSAWSHEWRNNVDALSRTTRCTIWIFSIRPVRSSRDPLLRAALHIAHIRFVSRVIDAPTVPRASSLSGAYG